MNGNDSQHHRLYRSRSGLIMGVCKGLADYFRLPVFWLRVFVVLILMATGIWPLVGVYLFLAIWMKPEPIIPFDADPVPPPASHHADALRVLNRIRAARARRIEQMERAVRQKESDWERRFQSDG